MMDLKLGDEYSSEDSVEDYVATNIKIKVLFLKLVTAKKLLSENRKLLIK